VDLTRSQSEWAAELGTVREVLGRVLHRWKKTGLIRVTKRCIILLDVAGLKAEAKD
jgi:CRP-like cAMP-binding protein